MQNNFEYPNKIIGRQKEIEDIKNLFFKTNVKVVTLTGLAGVGKTRLGCETAMRLKNNFKDGIFFVDLIALRDSNLIGLAIAETLKVGESRTIIESLKVFLKEKEALLLLDNFENVIKSASIISDILSLSNKSRILITSRVPL